MTVMIDGAVVQGTEREIVQHLRETSFVRETKRQYKKGVRDRAAILHQEDVSIETYRAFLADLAAIGEITILEG